MSSYNAGRIHEMANATGRAEASFEINYEIKF